MRPLLLLLLAAAASGCAGAGTRPSWNCAVLNDDVTEVCVKKVCRDLRNGKFMDCP